MLLYSHIWDGLLKAISLAAFIIAAASWKLAERIQSLGIVAQSGSVFVMIVVVCLIWLVLYRQAPSILSSWMYARMTLRASVTFSEAKALRKLFQLDLSGKWIPLREIKNLPDDQRHDALLTALGRLGAGRKALLL